MLFGALLSLGVAQSRRSQDWIQPGMAAAMLSLALVQLSWHRARRRSRGRLSRGAHVIVVASLTLALCLAPLAIATADDRLELTFSLLVLAGAAVAVTDVLIESHRESRVSEEQHER